MILIFILIKMSIFIPNNNKYKKFFKVRNKHNLFEKKATTLKFGNFGIKAKKSGFITVKHLETLRLFLRRRLKKGSIIWFRVFPNIGISKKPIEVRMGKGKGAHSYWAFFVKKGRIVLEIDGSEEIMVDQILYQCKNKLPFQSKVVKTLF